MARLFVPLTYNIFRRRHPLELLRGMQRPSDSASRRLYLLPIPNRRSVKLGTRLSHSSLQVKPLQARI